MVSTPNMSSNSFCNGRGGLERESLIDREVVVLMVLGDVVGHGFSLLGGLNRGARIGRFGW